MEASILTLVLVVLILAVFVMIVAVMVLMSHVRELRQAALVEQESQREHERYLVRAIIAKHAPEMVNMELAESATEREKQAQDYMLDLRSATAADFDVVDPDTGERMAPVGMDA